MVASIILLVIGNAALFGLGSIFYRHVYPKNSQNKRIEISSTKNEGYNDFEGFLIVVFGLIGAICVICGGISFLVSI